MHSQEYFSLKLKKICFHTRSCINHTVFLLNGFLLRLFFTYVHVGRLQLSNNMVNKRAAYDCMTGNESSRIDDRGKVVTFHLPKRNPELNDIWIEIVNCIGCSATSSSVIGEIHIEERFIARGVRDRLKWYLNPIPSVHSKAATTNVYCNSMGTAKGS